MMLEQGLWIVLAVSIFFSAWGSHVLWRVVGLKLALDASAVSLLAFGGKTPLSGLRALALLVILIGTTLLFCALVLAFQFFRARMND